MFRVRARALAVFPVPVPVPLQFPHGLIDQSAPKTQNFVSPYITSRMYVMVNVRAARRYGIYLRSFSIPDEGGARVWYISCTRRDAYVNHFVVRHSPVPGLRLRSGPLRG